MKNKFFVLMLTIILSGCADNEKPNVAVVTADQFRKADTWCAGLDGVKSVQVTDYYYYCGKGCGYKPDYILVAANCNSGQSVAQRFIVRKD